MGEKTEKATPKKLRDARKKGQVAKAQDFPSALTFFVSIGAVLATSENIYNQLSSYYLNLFLRIPDLNFEAMATPLMQEAMMTVFRITIPILMLTAFAGVITNFLLIGPVLSFEVFKPDIKKFNPITNLKQKFKMKTLIELLKSLFKITGAAIIIFSIMWKYLPSVLTTVRYPIHGVLFVFASFLFEVIIKVGIFFLVIAVADLMYQRHAFAKEMMMEKHEIKQEYKNSEGDPHIKGKRKEIAREMAYSAGPEARVSMAKAVVTNPVHLAIALGYDQEKDPAPYILAMGAGHIANLITREADKHEIPVLRNIGLAHDLYEKGQLDTFVPIETYEAIAEILKWIQALEGGEEIDEDEESGDITIYESDDDEEKDV